MCQCACTLGEYCCLDVGAPSDADRNCLVTSKTLRRAEPECARQKGVVPHLRVEIERKVRAVDGDIMLDQHLKAPVHRTSQCLGPRPEKPVMHDEKIRALVDGPLNGPLGCIDGHGNAPDRTLVLDLDAVEGARVVRHLARP
jgi:hypothetical protein